MIILRVSHVSAHYEAQNRQSLTVLDNFSIDLAANNLVVLVGPSGCGKTTLLNLIAGFIKPTQGNIEWNGKQVSGPDYERGVIFQQDTLLPWLNVLDNVAFGLQLQGIAKPYREATARRILESVNMTQFAEHRVWELSGGMKQRVSLARALAANPKILLMDEPFGALDAFAREQMQELTLQVWHNTGTQILLVTHDIEEALFLASQLIVMAPNPGRVVENIKLGFGKRFLAGESTRQIKSDPTFIKAREYLLSHFFSRTL